ncbi:MAG: hypothetical protein A2104_05295 [Candidatus Melainabacteria bacterium GWF2_32_7]|nr:MAG: hypothetical protein A2104_05295 [Candidatus Melainabacteria bacterium GWF2_32_7]
MNKRRILKLFLRIAISIIFIYFLLRNSNVVEIVESLIETDHKILILGVFLYILGQLLSAYKWKLLAQIAGFQNKLKEYFDYYFIGMFFNLFLPTTVGGDITKCYYLAKGDSRKAPAVYSVLAERYTGVIVIVWMATIALFSPIGDPVPFEAKAFMGFMSLLTIIITPTFPYLFLPYMKKKKWVRTLLRDIKVYWANPRIFVKALYWSVLFHLLIIAIHVTIGQAMGINIPLAYYFILYPMAAMAGFIPIAFNGIGPREGTYIYFLSLIGIKSSTALAFGIYWFGIVLFSSLIGGIFYIKGKHTPPPEEFENFEFEDEDNEPNSNQGIELDEPQTQS